MLPDCAGRVLPMAEGVPVPAGPPTLRVGDHPAIGDTRGDALALQLGPVRYPPGAADGLTGYVASPMTRYLGGSRLALRTIADWLADPAAYDPDAAWLRAMERTAGDDAAALYALRTQAAEWGGWRGGRNARPYLDNRPESALADLRDPAAFALHSWTVERYADRMRDLEGLADSPFRADLLRVMARRLAVARALPVLRAMLRPDVRPGVDRAALLEELGRQRAELGGAPDARDVLDRLLRLAGIAPEALPEPEPAPAPAQPAAAPEPAPSAARR